MTYHPRTIHESERGKMRADAGPFLFRDSVPGGDVRILERAGEEEGLKPEKEPLLLCRFCGHAITSPKESISFEGRHSHTFMNPAGIVYTIGCFSEAKGCSLYGNPSSEYTWFTGYRWTVALCGRCGGHMGWHYSSGESSFYGLILENLSEN
jgi:hypothetical protein